MNVELRRMLFALSVFVSTVVLGGVVLWGLGGGRYGVGDSIYFALITSAGVGFAELPGMATRPDWRSVTP